MDIDDSHSYTRINNTKEKQLHQSIFLLFDSQLTFYFYHNVYSSDLNLTIHFNIFSDEDLARKSKYRKQITYLFCFLHMVYRNNKT